MSAVLPVSERPVPESIRWYYYIHLCGDGGREWIRQYESINGMEIARKLDSIIGLCRRRRIASAMEILAQCQREAQAAEAKVDGSVSSVLMRWLFSTEAYALYACGDLGGARERLRLSSEAICQAISKAPFLVGLAIGFAEFSVHFARIARDERKWQEMRECFALARAMCNGAEPLCKLGDGTSIFVSDIESLVASLSPRNLEELEGLQFLLDRNVVIDGIERLIRRVELLPNVVVPFR